MRLRTRLAIGLAGLSLFAAGGLAATARRAIGESFHEEREQAIANVSDTVERNRATTDRYLRGMLAGVDETLATQLSASGRPLLKAASDGDPEAQHALIGVLEEQASQRQLDVLDLVQTDGRVLASAHWPASSLSLFRIDSAVARRAGTTGPTLVQTPAPDGSLLLPNDTPASRLALLHTRTLDSAADLFLSGGVFLDDPVRLRALAGDPDTVSIEVIGRAPVEAARDPFRAAATTSGAAALGPGSQAAPREDVVLERTLALLPSFDAPDANGRTVLLRVGRIDEAAAFQQRLLRDALAIASLLVVVSLVLASLMARRFAAPIDALATGARAVAAGDLDHRVPLPRGGRKDELVQLVEAFNGMSRDLKDSRTKLVQTERVAAWREIAQRIAHEIKNPLTPIQLAVETTRRARREKRKDFDEIFEESATAILEEVESLKRLVKEFSEFARMPEPVLAPDDVNEAIEGALRVFAGLPDGVKLSTELATGLPKVALDRDQLGRALLNLVANAADAVGPTGSIVVRTTPTADERGDAVEIHIQDDGPGVDVADRERIFTPYFTTKSTGTGLGLAIVQRIVTDHGGEISVRTGSPRGADFVVRLRAT